MKKSLENKCLRCAEDRRYGLLELCKELEHANPTWPIDRLMARAKIEWEKRRRVPMQIMSNRIAPDGDA